MLISPTKRFIFFHVAKVAGLSIRAALQPYCEEPTHFKIARPPRELADGRANPLYEMWANSLLHAKARDARQELPAQLFDGAFKFAFVRNPWDWQVSMYHFILKRTDHVHHARVRAMRSFEEYLEWVIATPNPFTRGATKYQQDMVTDRDGNLLVDFIGRFETLNEDFAKICERISITAHLPAINRTEHRAYASYYNERSAHWVAEHFACDIQRFGYQFESQQRRRSRPEQAP